VGGAESAPNARLQAKGAELVSQHKQRLNIAL